MWNTYNGNDKMGVGAVLKLSVDNTVGYIDGVFCECFVGRVETANGGEIAKSTPIADRETCRAWVLSEGRRQLSLALLEIV